MRAKLLSLALTLAAAALATPLARGQVNILTNFADNSRTGANLHETTLQVANVNVNQFGKLYTYPIDGGVQAEPLYVAGVTINGTTYNVLYVVTLNDKVYAFDADHNAPALWTRDFTNPPTVTPIPLADIETVNGGDLPNVGVRSTPVIDSSTGTIYLVAHTKENGTYVQRLHALDITTGAEKTGSPVVITASVPGTAQDAVNGMITFNPKMENQRAGLALTNGVVVIAWASHDDTLPYHGWVMGYNAATLAQVGVFCTTPDYYYGGIWQAGKGPIVDSSGNVYFEVGNAIWDGVRNWGDSVLKLSVTTSGISLLDWFTPSDWANLNTSDLDLGSTGPILLPNSNTLAAGGKESIYYLLNASNLGHETSTDTQIIQKYPTNTGHMHDGPVYWNSATAGPLLYHWGEADVITAYHFNGTTLDSGPYARGNVVSAGHPGGALSLTANGNASGTGIVWANITTSLPSDSGYVPGILRAYNAETLQEIWNAEQNSSRDRLGTYMKFVPPVAVNGKVYMPNLDNAVVVYGLLSTTPDFTIAATPSTQSVSPSRSSSYTLSIGAVGGLSGAVNLSVSGAPTGVTTAFNPASVTGSGSSTLQVTVGSSVPVGNYTLTITGTSGTLSHAVSVNLSVTANSIVGTDAQISTDGAQASATITSPTFSTASGNELLLAFVATDYASGANVTVTSVNGAGLTWALVQRTNVQSGTSEIWRAFSSSPLSNVSVTANLSQSVVSSITVMSFSGVDTSGTNGSGAIGATGSGNAGSGAPAATLVTTRASSLVVGVGNDFDNAIARTPAAGQTLIHQDFAPVGDTYWVQIVNGAIPVSGTSVTLRDTAPTTDRYNLSIVEVLPAAGTPTPNLTVAKSHSGSFTQGQTGATYTITVTNAGSASSSGTVTVTDTLPTALSATALSGTGWTCTAGTLTCTRNDVLIPGSSYPAITLTVNVASNAPASVTNSVTVSGGNSSNNSAGDVTTINTAIGPPASIVATAGTSQSATVNTAFAAAMQATVKDSNNSPVSGASVSFAAPTSGATGSFSGSATVTTNSSGVATAPTFTANSTAGSYTVTASVAGANTPASFSLTNTAVVVSAIAVDVNKSTDRSSNGGTIASPTFTTTSVNELLLAFVSTDASSGGITVSKVSGGGLTWVLVVRTNTQLGTSEIWRAFATTTLSNATVTATLSQSVAASITVMSFTGVNTTGTNGSGAIGAISSGNANPGAPTASLVTTKNNSWVLGVGNDWDSGVARTAGANQAIVHQYLASVGDTYWVQRVTTLSAAGTTVMVNDNAPSTDRYNLSICEIVGP